MIGELENLEAAAAFWFALIFLLPLLMGVVAIVYLLFAILVDALSGVWNTLKKIFKIYL